MECSLSTRWRPGSTNGSWPLSKLLRLTPVHSFSCSLTHYSKVILLLEPLLAPKNCLLRLPYDCSRENRQWSANNAYLVNINFTYRCHPEHIKKMRSSTNSASLLLPVFWIGFCFLCTQGTEIKAGLAVLTDRFAP